MDFSVLFEHRQAILDGMTTTLLLSLVSGLLAIALGVAGAGGLVMRVPVLSPLLAGYVQFFRNTPLLIQLYFFYKGLPNLGIVLTPMTCGILALTLQTGAYTTEIFRSGLLSLPREQSEGGLSLGLSRLQTFRYVLLPQTLRIVIPPLGNQMVGLVKNSSLVAFITVPDLFFVLFNQSAASFRYMEFFTVGILIYMALTLAVSALFLLLERQLAVKQTIQELHYA